MEVVMKIIYSLITCMSVALFAGQAHALRILNLDEIPHRVTVNNAGEVSEVTIQPGKSYYTYGPMVDISVKGQRREPMRAYWNGEYAIWPGGNLTLQRIRDNYRD